MGLLLLLRLTHIDHPARRGNLAELLVLFLVARKLEEVRDVKKGVALQADVDES